MRKSLIVLLFIGAVTGCTSKPERGAGTIDGTHLDQYQLSRTLETTDKIRYLTFGEAVIFAAHGTTVSVFDIASGRLVRELKHERNVKSVQPHPDNKHVFTCAGGSTVYKWDLDTGTIAHQFDHPDAKQRLDIEAIALDEDGDLLASGSDFVRRLDSGSAFLWSLADSKIRTNFPCDVPVNSLDFESDPRMLVVSTDSGCRVFNTSDGRELFRFGKESLYFGAEYLGLTHKIAVLSVQKRGSEDPTSILEVYNAGTGEKQTTPYADKPVRGKCTAAFLSVVAVRLMDGTVEIWDAAKNVLRARIQSKPFAAPVLALSWDASQLAVLTGKRSFEIWRRVD